MLRAAFVLFGAITYYWTLIGVPGGILCIVFSFVTRESSKKKKFLKYALVLLAGLPLFILLTFFVAKMYGTAGTM